MRELMQAIFGTYTPVTTTAVKDGQTYTTIVSGFAGVDWVYLGEIFLFGIVLISIFKIIGVLLKW